MTQAIGYTKKIPGYFFKYPGKCTLGLVLFYLLNLSKYTKKISSRLDMPTRLSNIYQHTTANFSYSPVSTHQPSCSLSSKRYLPLRRLP